MPAEASAAPRSSKVSDDNVEIVDIPLSELTPVRKRTAKRIFFERLESNIRAVGLIEPLLVHPFEGQHFILDGYLRYLVLRDLGATTVPCILVHTLDTYTPNRHVNYISMSQRWKMLKNAMTVVEEGRLKSALAIKSFRRDFAPNERAALAPEAIAAVADERVSKNAVVRLVHVNADRQREILNQVKESGDNSAAFIRTQVMRTPIEQRVTNSGRSSPWNKSAEVRKKLADRLTEAERNADFFQGVYRQYTRDLTVLAIYVRDVINHREVRELITRRFPDEIKLFQQIIQQTGDDA